jgi:hypothetical protein
MSWFKRALGMQAPKIPAGSRAFADTQFAGQSYVVRYGTPEQISAGECERVPGSPVFATNGGAESYAAWCNGTGTFDYGTGAV